MSLRDFLFSTTPPVKYYRHISFWLASFLPFVVLKCILIFSKTTNADTFHYIINYISQNTLSLLIDIGFTYTIVYHSIGHILKNKSRRRFAVHAAFVTAVAFLLKILLWYGFTEKAINAEKAWIQAWYLIVAFINEGSLMRCGLFIACKMLKDYYYKTEEKTHLLKENANAELQLLKAQVHPHFLFNTLNNIYSFTLNKSPMAGGLVLKLSDTLRYMITDCEAPLVPLHKELKMIRDYIGLETVRYGSRLKIDINVEGDAKNKMIAPLLMIPMVENSFKHGTSQVLDKAWINLDITIEENHLSFNLKNSKPSGHVSPEGRNGIGLKNVRKRIQLLYPLQHEFEIMSTGEVFEVMMRLPLTVNPENKEQVPESVVEYGHQ
jgi:hypothetical protein